MKSSSHDVAGVRKKENGCSYTGQQENGCSSTGHLFESNCREALNKLGTPLSSGE